MAASKKRIRNYKEFYAFYLTEHKHPASRKLHFTGTALIMLILIWGLLTRNYELLLFIPFVGYGFAWFGHYFYEKNKPATFQYPFWSLISDFKLFFEILTGRQRFNT